MEQRIERDERWRLRCRESLIALTEKMIDRCGIRDVVEIHLRLVYGVTDLSELFGHDLKQACRFVAMVGQLPDHPAMRRALEAVAVAWLLAADDFFRFVGLALA